MQTKRDIPDRVSGYGIEYIAEIGNVTANVSKYSNGRTPLEIITGEMPDTSEYLDFDFYDWAV